MGIEVSPEVLPHDQGLSIDTTHEEKPLSTSLVDTVGEKELSETKIIQNKPKKIYVLTGWRGRYSYFLFDGLT